MRLTISFAAAAALLALGSASATPSIPLRQHAEAAPLAATPVIDWSNEARQAIVPAGPGGSFGTENSSKSTEPRRRKLCGFPPFGSAVPLRAFELVSKCRRR